MRGGGRAARRLPPLRGTIAVPGDKSVSHRALLLGAVSAGTSRVTGANLGADVRATATILTALGAPCSIDSSSGRVEVEGCGYLGLQEPAAILDAVNSGTTLRTVAGLCASIDGLSVLTGDDSLLRRPMLRVVAPLRQMGARIDGRAHGDRAPLAVRGGALEGVEIEIAVPSAQVKTALLLAGLRARGTTTVVEPAPSRDHTERMLLDAGVSLERAGLRVTVAGGHDSLPVRDRHIPGDISSALFLIVAACIVPSSEVAIEGVGLNPTRTGALDVLASMGAQVEVEVTGEECGEPMGTVRAAHSRLAGVEVAPEDVPRLIDEVPILAVAATQAEGATRITGARELRVKESDRIGVMTAALHALGADVEELPDGLSITGPAPLQGGEVDAGGDHRIALALAVAGLVAQERVRVRGWSSVETSFPEFLDLLGELQGRARGVRT